MPDAVDYYEGRRAAIAALLTFWEDSLQRAIAESEPPPSVFWHYLAADLEHVRALLGAMK